jgi:RNA polymerase sigma-70 factor (ECF subfamily)
MSGGGQEGPPRSRVARHWDWHALRVHSVRVARQYARSPEQAEDIAQDALVRAWRSRASCRAGESPWAWMAQITRNEALRTLGRSRDVLAVDDEDGEQGEDDETLATLPDRIDVQAALAALSPSDRLIALLRYSEDLTQARIADLLGMPEGTVKVRLHRLRRTLHRSVHSP